jgi:hypothetical protein
MFDVDDLPVPVRSGTDTSQKPFDIHICAP